MGNRLERAELVESRFQMGIKPLDDVGGHGRTRNPTVSRELFPVPLDIRQDGERNRISLEVPVEGKERAVHRLIGELLAEDGFNPTHEWLVRFLGSHLQITADVLLEVVETGLDPD